jgi:hypothetical protein
MALESLTAKANVGAGTDALAVIDTAAGKAGAVALVDDAGVLHGEANPVPVSAASLPLPAGAATQATLGLIEGYFKAEDAPAVDGDKGLPLLAMRQAADTTSTTTDGDYTLLKIDEEGRLKVSTKPASYPDITGDITAIQATIGTPVAGGTVAGDVSRASNVMAFCSGTFSTVNCTFEGSLEASGDTNWFAIQAVRSNANTIETTTGNLSAQPAYAWEMSVNALRRVRVRATARTSGTQSWRFVQGTYATEPIPAAQVSATQPVSGTVTATVGTSITGGTISPLTVAGGTIETSAARTTTANGTTITNASGRGAMFYINVSAASGTTPTLVVQLQVQDPVSTSWIDITGAATPTITGTGLSMLTVCPGIVEAANTKVAQGLPRVFRFRWTIGGTTPSFTFSIGAQYLI